MESLSTLNWKLGIKSGQTIDVILKVTPEVKMIQLLNQL